MKEIFRFLKAKKVYSVAAWGDLMPFLVRARNIGLGVLKNKIGKKLAPKKRLDKVWALGPHRLIK
jgi:hypothetical protein